MNILLVSRDMKYSPSRTGADAAILEAVARELALDGRCRTFAVPESELPQAGISPETDLVFSMARSEEALEVLERWGGKVINSVSAVRSMDRMRQACILGELMPQTVCVPTLGPDLSFLQDFPCWVKRPGSHALGKDDVQFAGNACECRAAVRNLFDRGIGECVVQRHAPGCLIKFYGVSGAGLIHAAVQNAGSGKFGLEIHNDEPWNGFSFDMERLEETAVRAARLLGAEVWGGDMAVGSDGSMKIVDFNDWPSFGFCRDVAAKAIAGLAFK